MKQLIRMATLGILFLGSFSSFSQTLKEKAERGDMVAQYKYAISLTNSPPTVAAAQMQKTVVHKVERGETLYKIAREYGVIPDDIISQNPALKTELIKIGQTLRITLPSVVSRTAVGDTKEDNYRQAVVWLRKSAEQGYAPAQCYLGECYSHGLGVEKDMNKAVEWFKKGADELDTNSQCALALLYLRGDGVEKDSIFAADLLLHSAGGGWCSPNQLFTYDKQKANSAAKKILLELSSLYNSPKRHYFLAITGCLYDAMQDYKTAESYYKKSIDLGSPLGTIGLGLMYFYIAANTPRFYANYDNFEKSKEEGLGLESYKYSDNTACLEYVKTKVWTDMDNVTYWLEKAIGYGLGSFAFGSMPYTLYEHLLFAYVEGIGAKINLDRSIDIATLCLADTTIQEGAYTAFNALEMASNKVELQPKVFHAYLELYKLLHSRLNNENTWYYINAAARLGKCYYKGLGTTKNYNQAFKYLLEAANNGDCESMRLLAACYRYGRGTTANRTKENEWVEKAAKCGDEKAKRIRERRGR